MHKLAHNLPLQDMIRGVISNAKDKLAAAEKEKDEKVKKLISYEKQEHGGHVPSVKEEEAEKTDKTKTAGLLDPMYIEKLANACDFIAANADKIEPAQQGLIASTLQKLAGGKKVPPAVAGQGSALPVTQAIGGEQKYKKDQASTNTPEKERHEPLSHARPHDGSTQLANNMHDAPGGGGVTPTGKYPEKGPLVNLGKGKTASAGVRALYMAALNKEANAGMCKHGMLPEKCGECSKTMATKTDKTKTEKTKTAAEEARDLILQKLAGEDVMKANISASGGGGALVGDGVQKTYASGESYPRQPGGPTDGFGNQNRKHLQSSSAATDMTKKDAKGPVKGQLAQVLDEPALSRKTDSKLHENLRNTGEAGVKIAGSHALLEKIAKEGTPEEKQRLKHLIKTAMTGGMGAGASPAAGGMTAMATGDTAPDGCTCGQTGQCRVCKLKGALDAAKGGHSAHPNA